MIISFQLNYYYNVKNFRKYLQKTVKKVINRQAWKKLIWKYRYIYISMDVEKLILGFDKFPH